MTSTGPCHRPEGHSKTGHISKAALDAKRAKAKGKDVSPEAMVQREAIRAAKAQEAIAAAKAAHAAKIEKLREAALALGFTLTPVKEAAAK